MTAPAPRQFAESPCAPPLVHGGRLDAARRRFPHAPQPWIDLSTGVNPYAYPAPPLAPEAWSRLPDQGAFDALEAAARRAYRVPASAHIVVGAGAQAFIQWLPQVIAAHRVAVLGFTYAEHAARWSAAGADVAIVETLDALAAADVAVVVNPNNPDGRLIAPADVAALAARMAARGRALIVDESFMDLAAEHSVVSRMSSDNLIVLRSFGKIFGLPGLRLGFAICGASRAETLRAALGPWAVSGPALAVGAAALADAAWLRDTAAILARDSARLDALLRRAGFEIVGGAPLFRLAAHADAGRWFIRLAERGVLTRAFAERPHWLRLGLPGAPHEWARLTEALEGGNGG